MTNIITEAVNAVGASGADWRVQAGAAALLIVTGVGLVRIRQIMGWFGKRKAK